MERFYLKLAILSLMCLTAKCQAIDSTESSENEVLEDVSLDIIPQENLELNVTEMQPKNCSEKVHSYIGDIVEEKVNEVCTVNLFS